MGIDVSFSEQDRRRIEEAVRAVERETPTEIVPVVAAQSHSFDGALWRGATAGALLSILSSAALEQWAGVWSGEPLLGVALPGVCGASFGYALTMLVPWIRRSFVRSRDLDAAVRQRALVAFLEHEVFGTKERTGILVFLSLFERRLVILGDTGINACVEQREWDALAADLAAGVARGSATDTLIATIGGCAELLRRRQAGPPADDVNELPDRLSVHAG